MDSCLCHLIPFLASLPLLSYSLITTHFPTSEKRTKNVHRSKQLRSLRRFPGVLRVRSCESGEQLGTMWGSWGQVIPGTRPTERGTNQFEPRQYQATGIVSGMAPALGPWDHAVPCASLCHWAVAKFHAPGSLSQLPKMMRSSADGNEIQWTLYSTRTIYSLVEIGGDMWRYVEICGDILAKFCKCCCPL